jgi:hypothetical protein
LSFSEVPVPGRAASKDFVRGGPFRATSFFLVRCCLLPSVDDSESEASDFFLKDFKGLFKAGTDEWRRAMFAIALDDWAGERFVGECLLGRFESSLSLLLSSSESELYDELFFAPRVGDTPLFTEVVDPWAQLPLACFTQDLVGDVGLGTAAKLIGSILPILELFSEESDMRLSFDFDPPNRVAPLFAPVTFLVADDVDVVRSSVVLLETSFVTPTRGSSKLSLESSSESDTYFWGLRLFVALDFLPLPLDKSALLLLQPCVCPFFVFFGFSSAFCCFFFDSFFLVILFFFCWDDESLEVLLLRESESSPLIVQRTGIDHTTSAFLDCDLFPLVPCPLAMRGRYAW